MGENYWFERPSLAVWHYLLLRYYMYYYTLHYSNILHPIVKSLPVVAMMVLIRLIN